MAWDVLLCLDFEATCDDHEPPIVRRAEQEILEFSWVALDVATRTVVHAEQWYVRPTVTPITPFCTALTGITEETIRRSGRGLGEAVAALAAYWEARAAQGKRLCFVTHGCWDLEHQLQREAAQKAIPLPPYFGCYFNILEIFGPACKLLGVADEGHTLPLMCKALGMEYAGRLHTGLDDSKNIAAIVAELLKSPEVAAQHFVRPTEDLATRRQSFAEGRLHSLMVTGLPRRLCRQRLAAWLASVPAPVPESCSLIANHRSLTRKAVFMYDEHAAAARALARLGVGAGVPDRAGGRQPGEDADCLVFAKPLLLDELDRHWRRMIPIPETAEAAVAAWAVGLQTGDWFCATCCQENGGDGRTCRHCRRTGQDCLRLPQGPGDSEWVQHIAPGNGAAYGRLGHLAHTSDNYYLLDDDTVWGKADAVRVSLPPGYVLATPPDGERHGSPGPAPADPAAQQGPEAPEGEGDEDDDEEDDDEDGDEMEEDDDDEEEEEAGAANGTVGGPPPPRLGVH